MIHPFTKLHHDQVFHVLVGLWASLPCLKIPYPPQVQLGPNLFSLKDEICRLNATLTDAREQDVSASGWNVDDEVTR